MYMDLRSGRQAKVQHPRLNRVRKSGSWGGRIADYYLLSKEESTTRSPVPRTVFDPMRLQKNQKSPWRWPPSADRQSVQLLLVMPPR